MRIRCPHDCGIAPAQAGWWLSGALAGKFARPFKQQKKSVPLNTLLLLKLTITPLLVAGMSLAARRFGPTLGGLIMGLPWMTAPVLFFLGLERGEVYLAQSAYGALLAVPSIAAFALSYAAISRKQKWPQIGRAHV